METHSPSINLLKTKGNSLGDKFIKWALTIGRMVIILTETIALAAFLYRFVLDRQIIDQRDRINQKAARIKLYETSEQNFRNLQERLQLVSTVQNEAATTVTILSDVINMAPSGVTFNSITLGADRLHININTQSVGGFTTFVNALKKYPEVLSVSIDKIENKTLSATIVVSITAKLKIKPVIPKP